MSVGDIYAIGFAGNFYARHEAALMEITPMVAA